MAPQPKVQHFRRRVVHVTTPRSDQTLAGSALIIGASRGLGYAIVEEYLKRDWRVVGTIRDGRGDNLVPLRERTGGRLEIEVLDINAIEEIAALRTSLENRTFDLLFVNAGIKNDDAETIADVSTREFERVLVTNALSPMRVVEMLGELVAPAGTIAVMSSGQGSVANNINGGYEVYRASKAALNTLMRSYAARHATDQRTLLLMAPGWIRTDMGGPNARFSVEEAIPALVATVEAQRGTPGLQYLDRDGHTVAW
jgi:NAD(P)-dependent dehydrogenase (short-subunit alcohol dehydrogenase family)